MFARATHGTLSKITVEKTMLESTVAEEIGKLKAVEAIRVLKARYFRFVDTKRWLELGEIFTEDGVFSSRGVERSGRVAITGWLSGVIKEGVVTVHHGHMSEIEVDGDKATGIWAMEDIVRFPSGKGHHGYGHYHERYVCDHGTWRIAYLNLTRLYMQALTVPAAG